MFIRVAQGSSYWTVTCKYKITIYREYCMQNPVYRFYLFFYYFFFSGWKNTPNILGLDWSIFYPLIGNSVCNLQAYLTAYEIMIVSSIVTIWSWYVQYLKLVMKKNLVLFANQYIFGIRVYVSEYIYSAIKYMVS